MKKNIKDYIGTKTAIWIDAHTIEQENAIKDLLIADGRITLWAHTYELKDFSGSEVYPEYCLALDGKRLGGYVSKNYAESNNYQIIPASEFLQPEFEYLQEIEVSAYEDFPYKNKRQYIATLPNGKIVALNKDTELVGSWNYARKINSERTEAISTIKELMQKFNISKDEL